MENIDNRISIIELAESFDFEKLSSQQKSFVLDIMSKKEYQNIRLQAQVLKIQFNKTKAPLLNEDIKLSISQKILEQNKKTSILTVKIPLYQVAAGILIFITMYFSFLRNNNDIKMKKMEQLIVEKTDTINNIIHDTIFIKTNTNQVQFEIDKKENNNIDIYCQSEICPSEAIDISKMNNKQNIAAEPELNNYMVSIP